MAALPVCVIEVALTPCVETIPVLDKEKLPRRVIDPIFCNAVILPDPEVKVSALAPSISPLSRIDLLPAELFIAVVPVRVILEPKSITPLVVVMVLARWTGPVPCCIKSVAKLTFAPVLNVAKPELVSVNGPAEAVTVLSKVKMEPTSEMPPTPLTSIVSWKCVVPKPVD